MTDNVTGKLYANRDAMALGQFYLDHVNAMTLEGLHSKSAIAAELAWRDKRLVEAEKRITDLRATLNAANIAFASGSRQ
jgi:hypothetical protein